MTDLHLDAPAPDLEIRQTPFALHLDLGAVPGPQGGPGRDGKTPAVGFGTGADADRLTVDGVATGPHLTGPPGDPVALIDDSASGASKTWSAAKIQAELDALEASTPALANYYTKTETDARYSHIDHGHADQYDPAGTAAGAVAGHLAILPHLTAAQAASASPVQSVSGKTGAVEIGIEDTLGLQDALDAKAGVFAVVTALAAKADQETVNAALGEKADAVAVADALALKADQSALGNYPTTEQAVAAFEPKAANIQAHIGRTDNPHAVTAADVGSYTRAEADTLLSDKAAFNHGHAVAGVAGLQTVLDGKAAASHGHAGLMPAGGSAGQVLVKSGEADFATQWVAPSGGSSGGSATLAFIDII